MEKLDDVSNKVALAIKGDSDAFYELISERKEILYRTAFMYSKNREDALDIVGETVYKAYMSIRKLKHEQFFGTWITRILINCALDHLRKSKNLVSLNCEQCSPSKEDSNYNPDINIDLYSAIDNLTENCKTVVILKYFQDMTLTQIAEVLCIPIGTVKTYLHRALKELRIDLVGGEFEDEIGIQL